MSVESTQTAVIDRRYSSEIYQLQAAGHPVWNFFLMKIPAADRRDIRWCQTDRRADKIMIAKNSIGRVQSHPAGSRQKHFRPRVQRPLRASRLRVAFAQVTAHEARGQSHFAQ